MVSSLPVEKPLPAGDTPGTVSEHFYGTYVGPLRSVVKKCNCRSSEDEVADKQMRKKKTRDQAPFLMPLWISSKMP